MFTAKKQLGVCGARIQFDVKRAPLTCNLWFGRSVKVCRHTADNTHYSSLLIFKAYLLRKLHDTSPKGTEPAM